MDQLNYKYLKYKNKYLQYKLLLKKNYNQLGGDTPFITNIKKINLFRPELNEMSKFLNPIYGLIIYKSGFIPNYFYLKDEPKKKEIEIEIEIPIDHEVESILEQLKIIEIEESINYEVGSISEQSKILEIEQKHKDMIHIIKRIIRNDNTVLKPTKHIMETLKPIDFGRFIAIKYINNKKPFLKRDKKKQLTYISTIFNKEISDKLLSFINKFHDLNNNMPIRVDKYNDYIHFWLLLYCLWWITNNDNGIKEYYEGLNEVFSIFQKEQITGYDIGQTNPTFEEIIFNITQESFKLFTASNTKTFCDSDKTYQDCGEITARNLINLICFTGHKFDTTILSKFKYNQELINYYTEFNDFEKQASKIIDSLNSRDKWSELIIKHANNNVTFRSICTDTGTGHSYEFKSGLTIDNTKSNFFQLIQNFIGIEDWNDIKEMNNKITDINVNIDKKGFGTINITHSIYGSFEIICNIGPSLRSSPFIMIFQRKIIIKGTLAALQPFYNDFSLKNHYKRDPRCAPALL